MPGVWLRAKSCGGVLLRDGRGLAAPMRAVGVEPVWFAHLEPEAFEHDHQVEVVPTAPVSAEPTSGVASASPEPDPSTTAPAGPGARDDQNKPARRAPRRGR